MTLIANLTISFNVNGEETVKTNTGAAISMIIAVIILYYAALKLVHLMGKNNPNISEYEEIVT